jgi:hypothetical protein
MQIGFLDLRTDRMYNLRMPPTAIMSEKSKIISFHPDKSSDVFKPPFHNVSRESVDHGKKASVRSEGPLVCAERLNERMKGNNNIDQQISFLSEKRDVGMHNLYTNANQGLESLQNDQTCP